MIRANLQYVPLSGKAAVMFATPVVTVTRGDSPIIYGRENVKVWMRSTLSASDTDKPSVRYFKPRNSSQEGSRNLFAEKMLST